MTVSEEAVGGLGVHNCVGYAMMRFRFGYKFLLLLWLASLPAGYALAVPIISPLAPNHQRPAYVDCCIPGFFVARHPVQGSGSFSHDINAETSGRGKADLSAIPIIPKHIHRDC